LLTGASLAGAMLGQILFGAMADQFGRRLVFITTAGLVALSCLCSAVVQDGVFGLNIYTSLAIIRFFMGLGVGGEYPLSAASTVENVDAAGSGQALATTFAGMALGMILAPLVVMILSALAGPQASLVWRLSFAFGAIFATVLAFLRFGHLKETKSYDAALEKQEAKGSSASALWMMRRSLAGTAGSWLLYDIVTYGVGLFTTMIFPAAPGFDSALVVLCIAMMAFPGTLLAIPLAGYMRMQHVQLLGLGLMMLCFILLSRLGASLGSDSISWSCLIVFSLMRCADNGPGMATFSIPGQIFPTRIRGTAHGISAASGKLGAVIGTFIFPYLNSIFGTQMVMGFMAAVSALTMLWTWAFVPTYSVEDLEAIAKSDNTMTLERQAVFAERLLFAGSDDKGKTLPVAIVNPSALPAKGIYGLA